MSRLHRDPTILTIDADLTERARRELPPWFLITRLGVLYWFFDGPDTFLLNTTVATHAGWKVRPRRWTAREVARYWSHKKELWLPFLDYCEASGVEGNLYVGNGLLFDWVNFPYDFDAIKGETVPPASEVVNHFDELCALLEGEGS